MTSTAVVPTVGPLKVDAKRGLVTDHLGRLRTDLSVGPRGEVLPAGSPDDPPPGVPATVEEAAAGTLGIGLMRGFHDLVDSVRRIADRPAPEPPVVTVTVPPIELPAPTIHVAAPNVTVEAPPPAAVNVTMPQEKRPSRVRSYTRQGERFFEVLPDEDE
jgi:hypothetical protein